MWSWNSATHPSPCDKSRGLSQPSLSPAATKLDTRSRAAQALDTAAGWRLCKALKLHGFQECSSKTGQGVSEVFNTAVEVALRGQKQKPSCWQTRCVLL